MYRSVPNVPSCAEGGRVRRSFLCGISFMVRIYCGNASGCAYTTTSAVAARSALTNIQRTDLLVLATRHQHDVQVQEEKSAHHENTGLNATNHFVCEGAVSPHVCDRVLRRCAVTLRRCVRCVRGRASRSSQLATQAQPSQPQSRLMRRYPCAVQARA